MGKVQPKTSAANALKPLCATVRSFMGSRALSSLSVTSRHVPSITASKAATFAMLLCLVNFLARSLSPDDSNIGFTSRSLRITSDRVGPRQEDLFHAWRMNPETCQQWISAQHSSRAYLDAYIIGAQKASTSEMSTRLYGLGVVQKFMRKEWQFFNQLQDPSYVPYRKTELHRPYQAPNIASIRLPHYLSGFPHHQGNVTTDDEVPLIDNSPRNQRKIVYDSTVEYMLSDRVAFLASLLNPHAKIMLTVREPISRALSQYNMLIRTWNREVDKLGVEKIQASPKEFDLFVRREMKKLSECGYDKDTGDLTGSTSELLSCLFPDDPKDYHRQDRLYVTRGLYHLHIDTWRRFFPDHRMKFIRFGDVTSGEDELMQEIADFLCVRRYPDSLLKEYQAKASNVSYGVQAARLGLNKWRGFDSYEGANKYLTEIYPSTRKALEDFYEPANQRLFAMMGKVMY